ncbi:DNA polymerase III delta subunit [Aurantiacibacter atlanticus]|uniref:DNA-directed DNA polymerase n=1 Tax=Aurantiacibacter atlanticus TaxID=1648404 RepID=A0A0H4VVE3_9SPHN|nr:DNA polymerase III subunit delta [Aurantiacibacter atlanticus]AKQ41003.1 DNA polymerase III delta subunit [Aurantiacibacter atlanticus]MDF1834842.1 DNA polymerase III subunit delta [Alteraurantiacibacter sp. bin_em_oilr2.035]
MKATQRDYAQAAKRAAKKCRLFFFCGQDEAGASAGVAKLVETLPEAGERVDLSGSDLKSDPSKLVDEARSTSLFGDTRHIVARVSGEEAHDAIAAWAELVDRGEVEQGWPIFIIATSATDKSRSAKLLLKRDDALVAVFYPPDLKSMTADVRAMADASGMRLDGVLAEAIARAAGLDVRLAQSEIDKLALYLDASPQSPKLADQTAFDAIGAKTEEDGFMPLVNAALGGELNKLPAELARMKEVSLNPVGVALAMERRAAQLAMLAPKMRHGDRMDQFLKANGVFFKEHREVGDQLKRWSGGKLERLVPRLADLHRALLANSQTAELLLARELVQIAHYAAARR